MAEKLLTWEQIQPNAAEPDLLTWDQVMGQPEAPQARFHPARPGYRPPPLMSAEDAQTLTDRPDTILSLHERYGADVKSIFGLFDRMDNDPQLFGIERQKDYGRVAEETLSVWQRYGLSVPEAADVQQQTLVAGKDPTALDWLKEWVRKHTGYFEPPIYGGPRERAERPLATMAGAAAFYSAAFLSGLGLNIPDIIAHKAKGDESLALSVSRITGFEVAPKEIQSAERLQFLSGLHTAGGLARSLVDRIAARHALKVLLAGGLTFGTRKAAEEFSERVVKDEPIDWEGIHFESGLGVLFAAGELGLRRFVQFARGWRAGKALALRPPGAKAGAAQAKPGTRAGRMAAEEEATMAAARQEIQEALRHYRQTGDRSVWDKVRTKYTGAPAPAAGPVAPPVEPVPADAPFSPATIQRKAAAGQALSLPDRAFLVEAGIDPAQVEAAGAAARTLAAQAAAEARRILVTPPAPAETLAEARRVLLTPTADFDAIQAAADGLADLGLVPPRPVALAKGVPDEPTAPVPPVAEAPAAPAEGVREGLVEPAGVVPAAAPVAGREAAVAEGAEPSPVTAAPGAEVPPAVVEQPPAPAAPLPLELQGLAERARGMSKEEFLAAYQSGLSESNLTKRETAQKVDAFLRRMLKITPEEFYDRYVSPPAPAEGPGFDLRHKGVWDVTDLVAAAHAAHDWLFAFGAVKRADPKLYAALMRSFAERNAAVEKAVAVLKRVVPAEFTAAQARELAYSVEDERLAAPGGFEAAHRAYVDFLERLETAVIKAGILSQPFNERMIDENLAKIEELKTQRLTTKRLAEIAGLEAENEELRHMRYLPHTAVARAALEAKINRLKAKDRPAFYTSLTQFYRQRTGKLFLKDYVEAGLIDAKDVDIRRLAAEALEGYYYRQSVKTLFDTAEGLGYVKPESEALRAEGWHNAGEIGIRARELKGQLVHPLFAEALAEMQAMRHHEYGLVRRTLGLVKVGQFLKPSIVWVYDGIQKYMKGMYLMNPLAETKLLVQAAKSVLTKDALYHQLNEANLFQFPAELPRSSQAEQVELWVRQNSPEISRLMKLWEKATGQVWTLDHITFGRVLLAAHQAVAQVTWHGDKVLRTQSYLVLRELGYGHAEAVRIAAQSHGAYSVLSKRYKDLASKYLFVMSFRFLMPIELAKIVTDPLVGMYDALKKDGGLQDVPRHEWNRWMKALLAAGLIPVLIDEYMKRRGYEKEGKHLGPLAWKWKKTVTVDGQEREHIIGINTILNMPVKMWNRLTYYNPLSTQHRGIEIFDRAVQWEANPLWRIAFWDVYRNRRSFGSGQEYVYDPHADTVTQAGQIAKYAFGNTIKFWGHVMDAVETGQMTNIQVRELEQVHRESLEGMDRILLQVVGYDYLRMPLEERQAILVRVLEAEVRRGAYNIRRRYDPVADKEKFYKQTESLRQYAERCSNYIKNEMK